MIRNLEITCVHNPVENRIEQANDEFLRHKSYSNEMIR